MQRSRERQNGLLLGRDYRDHTPPRSLLASNTRWSSRRLRRSHLWRVFLLLGFLYTLLDAYSVYHTYAVHHVGPRPQNAVRERIFIASIHWNNEVILRSHWTDAVFELVKVFGRNNTFISIQESGSWDDTKGALRELDTRLGSLDIKRKVILDETTHLDEVSRPPASSGWIDTPRGKKELRRIPYLSRLRNLVLEPLKSLAEAGEMFDKIIFLNDVIFTPQDIDTLLDTRGGDYAAVCALDFSKPPGFYDTFALRDSEGQNKLMKRWPYFRAAASRNALKANQAVPVASCWNGITVIDAQPFYDSLRFRGISDSLAAQHLEASECCLIHTDNPLTASKGVWINHNVRVAYNEEAYKQVNPQSSHWLSYWTIYISFWENRLRRWFTTSYFKDAIVSRRLRTWTAEAKDHVERGTVCLVNEMQVLVENGWAHV